MEELVSIVVPVYNVEAYLDECVQSLVDQTYRNLEIILVNDGSTDRSGSICDLWAQKDERIRVIHKENAGAGMARNTGMDMTKTPRRTGIAPCWRPFFICKLWMPVEQVD